MPENAGPGDEVCLGLGFRATLPAGGLANCRV